jgi:hypothetical protein
MAGSWEGPIFPAIDFPPMDVVIDSDQDKDDGIETHKIKKGWTGIYDSMWQTRKNGKTSRIVRIRDPKNPTHHTRANFDDVTIGGAYPFRADRSTLPAARFLTLKRGDLGYTEQVHPDTHQAFVTIPEKDVSGWVDTKFITIGTERKYGDWALQYSFGASSQPDTKVIPIHTTLLDTCFSDAKVREVISGVAGLNVISPAAGTLKGMFYSKVTLDGTTIYRKPSVLSDKADVASVGENHVGIDQYKISRDSAVAPLPSKTRVHMAFEVNENGQPHPHAWLRLPTTCLFEDASRALTLAIRIEWENDDGKPEREYLKNSFDNCPLWFNPADLGCAGQYDGMGVAIAILNFLENREVVGPKRAAVRYFGRVRMLKLDVNHLRQQITLEVVSDLPQKILDARPRDLSVICQELAAAGAQSMDVPFGTWSYSEGGCGKKLRKACDRCFVATTAQHGHDGPKETQEKAEFIKETIWTATGSPPCVLVHGTNRCICCAEAGIPCTYTADVCEMPALMLALWPVVLTGHEVHSAPDSKFVTAAEFPTFGPAHVGVGE